MPKSDSYIIGYATVVCLISSLLLAATTAGLKTQQDRMVELDRKFNVLKAFHAQVSDATGAKIPGDQIEKLYAEYVRELVVSGETGDVVEGKTSADFTAEEIAARKVLPLFEWVENGDVKMYAFPTSGKGLWSTIYGYVALDATASQVVGVTFYRHGETPGLGGEVDQPWFQKQFEGLPVFRDGQLRRIVVARGKVTGPRSLDDAELVDGISGATLTGNGVTSFLNRDLATYEKYFRTQRKG